MERYLKNNTSSLPQRATRWLKIKATEFERLIASVGQFGLFSPLIKFRISELLVHTFIYPIVRIALGRERASNFCEFLTKNPSSTIFTFPKPLKSKLFICDNAGWTVAAEMFINDIYQKDAIKEGMNIIDIGAHIGAHTVYFAEKVGKRGKVIAVEPEPKNYKEILENIHLNGLKNVIPINTALSDKNALEKLYINSSSAGHSLLSQMAKNSKYSPFIQTQVKTLDTLLEELQVKKIDVLKIDAEGVELQILKGSQQTLKNNPGVKIMVASYHYPNEVLEVQHFLQERGFKTNVSHFDIVSTV